MASRSSQLALFGNSVVPRVPDITRSKHKGNKQSERANERVFPSKVGMRERVRIFVAGCGFHGATLHEICKAFNKLPHQISGRISEAKAEGEIFDSGRTRRIEGSGDCAVLVSKKEWVNQTL